MTRLAELGLALRLARREMRGGTRGLRVFLACLALGVAAIAAVGTFAAGVGGGLAANARAILGGDVQLVRSHVPVDSAVARAMEARGQLSRQVDLRVMVRARQGQGSALAELKAVDGAYPLYGKFSLRGGFGLTAALAGRDGLPGAVAEQALLERLDAGAIHCVTFTSSSTVENFFTLVAPDDFRRYLPQVKLASIGPVTSRTLARFGFTADIEPADYTIPALAAALAGAL